MDSGQAWGEPACCPGGIRRIGGASPVRAPAWNVGSCVPESAEGQAVPDPRREEDPQAAESARGRVPVAADAVADRPVVVMKPGNAGGAKGPGCSGPTGGQLS
jgi:hypothetical protein